MDVKKQERPSRAAPAKKIMMKIYSSMLNVDINYQLSNIKYQILNINYQLSIIKYQISDIKY